MRRFLHILCHFLFVYAANATPLTQAQRLALPNSEGPVDVNIAFQLLNINEINDETETLQLTGILTLQWNDQRQRFNPDIEGANELLYSGSYQFDELSPAWYPQVFIVNAIEPNGSDSILMRIRPDGTCTLTQTVDTTIKVDLDVRQFPFDHQSVSAIFDVLGFHAGEVALTQLPNPAYEAQALIQVPEWDFKSIHSEVITFKSTTPTNTSAPNTAFIVSIELERQPMYMMRLVILPLTLIVMLSWSVFWMDRSSLGDRMSVSFVGILTAVTYQIMIGDTLPQISYFNWMNAFIICSFGLMCITVVLNLIVGALDKRGHYEHGDRIDRLCRRIFPSAYLLLTAILFVYFF